MPVSLRPFWPLAVITSLVFATGGCTTLNPLQPSSYWSSSTAPPGTTEWWKHHKKEAVFVPGEGFQVAGYDGFFDERGRPIQAIAPVSFEEDAPTGLDQLDPKYAYERVKSVVGQGPDQEAATTAFATGKSLYAQKNYREAVEHFEAAANKATEPALQQDARFMHAEALFFSDQYTDANDAYLQLVTDFPSTQYLDKAIARQSAIARFWHDLHNSDPKWPVTPNLFDPKRPRFDTLGHALKTYENIRLNDPTGPLADDALMATANAHFLRGYWDDADYHYELLRREYPNSPHQLNAHLLGLQSKLRKYQGADYDANALEEAKQLSKQLRIQFGHELPAEEQARLREIEAMINRNRATRDWEMAKFYEEREYYKAARYYYTQLIEGFPNSELATQAREQIAAIRDKPDTPPERLGWLMQVFPESRDRAAISAAAGRTAARSATTRK